MGRLLDEGDVIDAIYKALRTPLPDYRKDPFHDSMGVAIAMANEIPPAQPEIGRCHKCGYWDRDSLRHQHNVFRDWNEAECKILAERDPYDENNRYTEADDYCSKADRRQE